MDLPLIVVLLVTLSCLAAVLGTIYAIYKSQKKDSKQGDFIEDMTDENEISDKEILEFIQQQPDGFLSAHHLSAQKGIQLNRARTRLQRLMMAGILKAAYNAKMRYHYFLQSPIKKTSLLDFSDKPYLTTDDLIKLFESHNGRLTYQQIILATNLSFKTVKKEMKFFMKENVVDMLNATDSNGITVMKTFILKEPYRSDPESFLELKPLIEKEIELHMRSSRAEKS